ncbi:hypothetical protein D9615_001302 [Tricholomella constricta]|uniref:Homeobox domain-containing protein n=1 Tax=Tricholomella constricta TaxID=117010 RepID=A0A8H5M938_9AGAR|nr:hypothetical protein D9615_001302 [Tricholomella constricta]
MHSDLDIQFLHRISLIENDLLDLDRLSGDDFISQWSIYADDLQAAIDAGSLSPSTVVTAQALADRTYEVVQSFVELEALSKKLTSSLMDETSSILATLAIDVPTPLSENINTTTTPRYIEPSYDWLLENIHDPYPSARVRDAIAQKSGAARKDVDAWFIDARKRIGWNALRKRHFDNKRLNIVDAATRFFVQDDPNRPLDPTIESEFAGIQKAAKDLYADRFAETKLATKLDIAVKDLTPAMKVQAREDKERRRQETGEWEENALAASSYPSPQPSPGRSPEPIGMTPLEQDEDLASTHPEAIAGRKRRNLTNARGKLDIPSLTTGLPSPTPSSRGPLRGSASPPPATNLTPLPTISRKRRLSDADGQGAPKRPRGLPTGPRLHAVSDPLPMTSALFEASSMDDWFNIHFGIPNPVIVDALDTSQLLDVEVFKYSVADEETPSTAREPLSRASYSPQSVDNDVPDLIADEAPFTPDGLEISTNTFDINELFTDYEELESGLSDQFLVNQAQDALQLMLQPPLLDFSSLANLPTIPFANSFDTTYSAAATQSLSLDSASDFNWFIPPFTESQDSFGPIDKLQDFEHVLAQDHSLMFCDSISGMSGLSAGHVGAQTEDKAEMERRLAAMKEAMRSLEEKIAQSS